LDYVLSWFGYFPTMHLDDHLIMQMCWY